MPLKQRDVPHQVEAQVERHLLVARSAGVQAPARITVRSTSTAPRL
jgi:hypothetical protein